MLRFMSYTLRGLAPALFESLFGLDEEALAARGMCWISVDAPVGFPCRISLEDAPVGERVLLLPFVHQDSHSAYRASGPIFVRRDVREARHVVGELPPYLTRRLLSVRAYDAADDMVEADVIDGAAAAPLIERFLARDEISYLHLHFAKRGCYACRVDRD
ncbi:MAG: DUF1203 domain-containing protein [Burkholderiales bacterium]